MKVDAHFRNLDMIKQQIRGFIYNYISIEPTVQYHKLVLRCRAYSTAAMTVF
jgi:hypothetical protein